MVVHTAQSSLHIKRRGKPVECARIKTWKIFRAFSLPVGKEGISLHTDLRQRFSDIANWALF